MNQKYLDVSVVLKDTLKLDNVEIRNNSNMSFEQLEETFQDREYDIAFVLETMEHVGTVDDMYGSRSEFLKGVFSLLKPGGHIVISVPRMVGPSFLIKNLIQRTMRLPTEHFSLREMFNAGVLGRTEEFESQWDGRHKGFNNNAFRRALLERFHVVRLKRSLITDFYLLQS